MFLVATLTSVAYVSGAVPQQDSNTAFLPERAGYYDTAWPSDHADLWRSHAVMDAGLPANFDPKRLAVSTVRPLNLPAWGYTRDRNEVFIIGGSPVLLDSFTQSIKNGAALTPDQLAASLAKDLLNPAVPYVAKIRPNAMRMARKLYLTQGWTVNYTGGLLMHQNGFVYAVSQSVLYKIDPRSMHVVKSVNLPLVPASEPFWTTYNGMQVIASGKLVLKGFDLLNNDVPGWLLLVDPDDLSFDVMQQTSVSSARLTIGQDANGEAWLYHVNATNSLRFKITEHRFIRDDTWTRAYRADDDGSSQASSPLLFGELGQIVFANNTSPVPDPTAPIHLFTQPVDRPPPLGPLTAYPAFSSTNAGFNFFMVAGDPFLQQLVVYYDPINNLLSAHKVGADGTLTPGWQDQYKCSASPAVAPDRDLLYVDDYVTGPGETDGRDYFVVLRLSTGEELARVPLDASLPTIGTIFLGMNDDVYLISSETGGTNGLVSRVYLRLGRR